MSEKGKGLKPEVVHPGPSCGIRRAITLGRLLLVCQGPACHPDTTLSALVQLVRFNCNRVGFYLLEIQHRVNQVLSNVCTERLRLRNAA